MILNDNNINNSNNNPSEKKEVQSGRSIKDMTIKESDKSKEEKKDEEQEEENKNNDEQQIVSQEQQEPLDEYTLYTKKIEEIKSTLNKDLSQVLLKIWSKLFENYVNECKSIFKFLRVQRETISSNYNLICQKFIDLLISYF